MNCSLYANNLGLVSDSLNFVWALNLLLGENLDGLVAIVLGSATAFGEAAITAGLSLASALLLEASA